jgi:S-formylglutathione hydrolase FrmB
MHFFGSSIGKATAFSAIIPQGKAGPFPVLYLLHGLSDDHTIWLRRTSIERYAADMNLMIIMPDGGRGFYVNDPRPGGPAWEDHIASELVALVDGTFHTVRHRRGRAIAGLSMGGYGALMLAMRHPDVFSAAVSHSGALMFNHTVLNRFADVETLSASLPRGRYDLWRLATALKRSRRRLAIRMDCGTEDRLLEFNRQFHAHLEKLGLPHEYAEHPGSHDWAYWDLHIRQTLEFVARRLGLRS